MAPRKGMERDDRQVPQVSIWKISISQRLLAPRSPPEPRRWRAAVLALRGQGADLLSTSDALTLFRVLEGKVPAVRGRPREPLKEMVL